MVCKCLRPLEIWTTSAILEPSFLTGYYAVYLASLSFTLIGIVYIYFVPESVTERLTLSAKHQSITDDDDIDKQSLCQKLNKAIKDGNRTLLSSIK